MEEQTYVFLTTAATTSVTKQTRIYFNNYALDRGENIIWRCLQALATANSAQPPNP